MKKVSVKKKTFAENAGNNRSTAMSYKLRENCSHSLITKIEEIINYKIEII